MKTKQNILIIHNQYKYAGGEDTVAENERQLLHNHGHKVILYTRNNNELDIFSLWRKILLPFTTIFSFKSYREVTDIIKKNDIQVVHIHNTLPLVSLSVYYAAKKQHCILVQAIHNMRLLCPNGVMVRNEKVCELCVDNGLRCAIKYSCYRNSKLQSIIVAFTQFIHRKLGTYQLPDAYLVQSEFSKEKISHMIPSEKIFLKPNYSNSVTPNNTKATRDYFIYVSRLERIKGIFLALEAFEKLPHQHLIVMGVGPDEEKAKRYVIEHKMSNIEFVGFKTHSEMLELLANAAALIFSTQWYEGFPMTIIESFVTSTPVIGSNIGNIRAVIKDGYNGYLFKHDSSEDLCATIDKFLSSNDTRRFMEANAFNTYMCNHSPTKNYEQLMAIYEKFI